MTKPGLKYFQKINVFNQISSSTYLKTITLTSESVITVIDNLCTWSHYQQIPTMIFHRVGELGKRAALGVFMYFVSPYIFCEGVPSLHSHTSGLSWSGPNYHSSNRPALPSPTLPAIEHPPSFSLYKLWNWRKSKEYIKSITPTGQYLRLYV